jgi:hypothetical protein
VRLTRLAAPQDSMLSVTRMARAGFTNRLNSRQRELLPLPHGLPRLRSEHRKTKAGRGPPQEIIILVA